MMVSFLLSLRWIVEASNNDDDRNDGNDVYGTLAQ